MIDKMMKECIKTHPLLHTVGGVGIGLLLVYLLPAVVANSLVLGLVLLAVGVVGEFVLLKK